MNQPAILVIGAQKAGTTWLYQNLARHPDVWVPPIKELHYFDREPGRHPLRARVFGRDRADERWRRQLRGELRRLRRGRSRSGLSWALNYFLRHADDDWYVQLFAPAGERLGVDVTPDYSRLDPGEVDRVRRVVGDAWIVFFLRNPIERAWSHATMELVRMRLGVGDTITDQDFLGHFANEHSTRFTDYEATLQTWSDRFGADRTFVGFLEDIEYRPRPLMRRLSSTLGLGEPGRTPRARKVFHGGIETIPTHLATALAERYEQPVRRLAARFGGHTLWWQHCVDRLLHSPPNEPELAYPLSASTLREGWEDVDEPPPLQSHLLARLDAATGSRQRCQ